MAGLHVRPLIVVTLIALLRRMGSRLFARSSLKENDLVVPLVCQEFDVVLFRQSAEGAKQHMPGVVRERLGEIGEHHARMGSPKRQDVLIDLSFEFRSRQGLVSHGGLFRKNSLRASNMRNQGTVAPV